MQNGRWCSSLSKLQHPSRFYATLQLTKTLLCTEDTWISVAPAPKSRTGLDSGTGTGWMSGSGPGSGSGSGSDLWFWLRFRVRMSNYLAALLTAQDIQCRPKSSSAACIALSQYTSVILSGCKRVCCYAKTHHRRKRFRPTHEAQVFSH